jgi:ABC-2 type transport system permease protein
VKALLIAGRDLWSVLTDRSLLVLMFAAPLALATIIAATFGGLAESGSPLSQIPVAVVNLDEGAGGRNFGDQLAATLTDPPAHLAAIISASEYQDRAKAIATLERGTLTSVLVIERDFTARLLGVSAGGETRQNSATADPRSGSAPADAPAARAPDTDESSLSLFNYLGRPIAADIVGGVVADLAAQFASGAISVSALLDALPEEVSADRVLGSEAFAEEMARMQSGNTARIEVATETVAAGRRGFNPLVLFGSTQAIFFALFAANASANSIIEEQADGTLLRLLVSPTRRISILLGKLGGTVIMILVQLLFLFVAFTFVGSLFEGQLTLIWGSRFAWIALAVVATAVGTAGVGIIVAAAARRPEQASIIGSVVAIFMATTGGAFGFQVGPPVAYASVVYWGARAFTTLAAGGAEVALETGVLAGFGVISFLVGLLVFNRRLAQ